MLQTIDRHIDKVRALNKYRDLEHITLYFIVYDHPGFWMVFIVAFAVHVTLGVKRRVGASMEPATDRPIESVQAAS